MKDFLIAGLIVASLLIFISRLEYRLGYMEGRQSVYTEQLNMPAEPGSCYAKKGGCK